MAFGIATLTVWTVRLKMLHGVTNRPSQYASPYEGDGARIDRRLQHVLLPAAQETRVRVGR